MSRMRNFIAVAVALFLGAVPQAKADTIAANMTGFGITGNGQFTVGWQFNVLTPITVTQLGFMGDRLLGNHQVGIWSNSGGPALVTGTVLTTDPITGLFHYRAVAPTTLAAGAYVIGGENDAGDTYGGLAQNFSTAAEIQYVTGRFIGGLGLQFPTFSEGQFAPEIFGPNFQFGPAAPVPAGLQLGVIGAAVAMAGYYIRRYRARRVAPVC